MDWCSEEKKPKKATENASFTWDTWESLAVSVLHLRVPEGAVDVHLRGSSEFKSVCRRTRTDVQTEPQTTPLTGALRARAFPSLGDPAYFYRGFVCASPGWGVAVVHSACPPGWGMPSCLVKC